MFPRGYPRACRQTLCSTRRRYLHPLGLHQLAAALWTPLQCCSGSANRTRGLMMVECGGSRCSTVTTGHRVWCGSSAGGPASSAAPRFGLKTCGDSECVCCTGKNRKCAGVVDASPSVARNSAPRRVQRTGESLSNRPPQKGALSPEAAGTPCIRYSGAGRFAVRLGVGDHSQHLWGKSTRATLRIPY